jgi:hypothetical protein
MASGNGKVMLLIGESFIEADEDYAEDCQFHSIIIISLYN